MTTAQKNDVRTWGNTLDVTAAITTCISQLPSTGNGVLQFPGGRYKTTGGFVLPYSTVVVGDGKPSYGLLGGTRIDSSSANTPIFNAAGPAGSFNDLGLVCTHATPVAGSSAIYVSSADVQQRVDRENVLTYGCYDNIDVAVGQDWIDDKGDNLAAKHYGIRIRNTVNVDGGGWSVNNGTIQPADQALAAIRIEGAGGGRITNNIILSYTGRAVDGISVEAPGTNVTQQLIITGNQIDNIDGAPINVVLGWPFMVIANNYLKAHNGGPAIALASTSFSKIENNLLIGSGAAGVQFNGSVSNMSVGSNLYDGFTYPASAGLTSNKIDYTGFSYAVADLPAANQVPVGTTILVTDANATTFNSIVAGGGSNVLKVTSNGTNWRIG